MSDRVRWTIREHHWGSQAKTWKVTKASREPGFQRAPCWSSLFLPESYNKGSSADLLHLAGTSAYELYLLTEGRVYRVQANQVQYFLDKCTRVFLLFHTEPKGAWRKGKDELLMTYLGYGKATWHLLDDEFLHMESLLCLHCPREGKENKQRTEPGSCHEEPGG